MNNDLISRSDLREDLRRFFPTEVLEGIDTKTLFAQIMHDIDNAPTVELCYQRPQGEWIKWNFKTFGAMGDWEYKCSNCEKVYGGEHNFCPNCGADMRGDEE